jgi:hypothetical protein
MRRNYSNNVKRTTNTKRTGNLKEDNNLKSIGEPTKEGSECYVRRKHNLRLDFKVIDKG